MNVDAISSQASARASLLAVSSAQGGRIPLNAQLQSDRNTLSQQGLIDGKPAARKATGPEDIKKAASQFEAIIMRQLLAPTIEPIMSGGMGGSKEAGGGIYAYMLTDVLATGLAQGGGLGWARMLEKQLTSAPRGADIKPNTLSKPTTETSPL